MAEPLTADLDKACGQLLFQRLSPLSGSRNSHSFTRSLRPPFLSERISSRPQSFSSKRMLPAATQPHALIVARHLGCACWHPQSLCVASQNQKMSALPKPDPPRFSYFIRGRSGLIRGDGLPTSAKLFRDQNCHSGEDYSKSCRLINPPSTVFTDRK